ncbi:MAG: helix-turn-helix domain-containing protein [Sphingomonadaceae bacterium]|nr:helix-turn-helix domain-containing protein [Sphingomonadaceae bacterium]
MTTHLMHPEDVKAAIRKKHGTIINFAKANRLSRNSVQDFLRGRTNTKVRKAVESLFMEPVDTPIQQPAHAIIAVKVGSK